MTVSSSRYKLIVPECYNTAGKVLILHHFESYWEKGFVMKGLPFWAFQNRVSTHLEGSEYKRIIVTRFEDWQKGPEHDFMFEMGLEPEFQQYDYGWDEEQMKRSGCEYVEGGVHSEVVWIPEWLKELKGEKVNLAGAFDGECIEDMEIALSSQGIDFDRLEDLIV